MPGMWNTAGKVKVFHKKAVFFRSRPGAFQEKYFIKSELFKCVHLLYCESACRERPPPPCAPFGSIIRSML